MVKTDGILFGNENIRRALKWFIYLFLFYNAFLVAVVPEYRNVGMVYLALGLITLMFYFVTKNKGIFFGLKKDKFFIKVFAGLGIAVGFLFIGNVLPGFTILIPSLSFSILTSIRLTVIGFIAPATEEPLFNDVFLNMLQSSYGLGFWWANAVKSIVFALYHIGVWGIALGALANLQELFGAVNAISGLLFTAFFFSFITGFIANKFKDLLPGWVAHTSLNIVLWSLGFVIITI